jgi:hypothetical protein
MSLDGYARSATGDSRGRFAEAGASGWIIVAHNPDHFAPSACRHAFSRESGKGPHQRFKAHLDIGRLRSPEIMVDAAYLILTSDAKTVTGNFFVDDEVLAAHGVTDLSRYNPPGVADIDVTPDLFVPSLRETRRERQ